MYSKRLLEHFQNPRNVGELTKPNVSIKVSNPICGDILHLSAQTKEGRVAAVRYLTRGCTASIAVGSALTEILLGKSANQLLGLTCEDIEQEVGGLPAESKHAAVLALDAAKALAERMSERAQ